MMAMTAMTSVAQRKVMDLKSWEFSKDKAQWENVQVPHDWAINGPFGKKWDMQTVAIVQNGEKQASEELDRATCLQLFEDYNKLGARLY